MITSGYTYRSLVQNNAFSAFFDLSFSNVTGSAQIGFSGNGDTYKFDFISGKIFDHQGRYFSSYQPNQPFGLSTNFEGAAYDYFINNEAVAYSGTKTDFNVENFYLDPSGVTIDNSIIIKSNKPSFTLSYPNYFVTGETITGHIQTNSVNGFKLFSGYFNDLSSFQFSSLPTGNITSTQSGQFVLSQNAAAVGDFRNTAVFKTSAGDYSRDINISGVDASFLDYVFEFEDNDPNSTSDEYWYYSLGQRQTGTGILKTAETSFNYSYDTNYPSLEPSSLPIKVSFSYYTGRTGYYGQVSSVSVVSGGNSYLSAPFVVFSGGGSTQTASGTANLGPVRSTSDKVVSVDVTSNGEGYTSAPYVVFNGGTGILNNTNPTIASGNSEVAMYTKEFTGAFNIYTGIAGNYTNFRSSSLTGSSTSYESQVNYSNFDTPFDIKIEYLSTFDSDNLVGLLSISGVNNQIVNQYITGSR